MSRPSSALSVDHLNTKKNPTATTKLKRLAIDEADAMPTYPSVHFTLVRSQPALPVGRSSSGSAAQ